MSETIKTGRVLEQMHQLHNYEGPGMLREENTKPAGDDESTPEEDLGETALKDEVMVEDDGDT
jgi:hypothetical protein